MNKIEKLIYERDLLLDLQEQVIPGFERFKTFLCHLRAGEENRQVELEELLTQSQEAITDIARKIEYLKIEYKVYHKLNSLVLLKKITGDYFNETTITDAIHDRLNEIYEEIMEDQKQ